MRAVMHEMKAGWQEVVAGLFLATSDGPSRRAEAEAGVVLVMAGVEGLALERLERGETPALRARARAVRELGERRDQGRLTLKRTRLTGDGCPPSSVACSRTR